MQFIARRLASWVERAPGLTALALTLAAAASAVLAGPVSSAASTPPASATVVVHGGFDESTAPSRPLEASCN